MRTTRRITLLLVALAVSMLLLVACGGGDDGDAADAEDQSVPSETQDQDRPADSVGEEQSGAADPSAPDDQAAEEDVSVPDDLAGYEAELRAIVEGVEAELDEAGEDFQSAFFAALGDVDLSDEEAVGEALAEVFREFLPTVLAIAEGGIDRLEALDPPARYEDDHAAFVRAVREIADLQDEATALLDDPVGADEALDELDRRQTEIEERLRAEVSPEFAALIEPFFSEDDDETGFGFGDDEPADAGGDSAFTFGDLPESFPQALVPPDASLIFADSQAVGGQTETIGSWTSRADPDGLLDFYEAAFADLGFDGEVSRLTFGDFQSVELISPDGEVVAAVVISPGGAAGEVNVLVTVTQ